MTFGSGAHTYSVDSDWPRLPQGWAFGWVPAVAVDSRDRVFVYSRSEHPLIVFDRDGQFLGTWGDDILEDAHGIFIDAEDNVFCVERGTHCVRKFSPDGTLVMTLGDPGQEAPDGEPFRLPTDIGLDSAGNMYVSDGYGNSRVHKYSPDGEHLTSWGVPGNGPGEFDLPHSVKVDQDDRVLVADRSNNRIQLFDTEGNYLTEWTGLHHPDTIFIDAEGTIHVAELDQCVSIWSPDGTRLAEWGRGERSDVPGEFLGCPHGIWKDSRGDLYVGEVQVDGRIQKFVKDGPGRP